MTRNKTALLPKKIGYSIRVLEVSSVPDKIKDHSIHGPLRIEASHDKEGRKSTAYSMDPSVRKIQFGDSGQERYGECSG